jgi:hemerythrin superfamily protein
MKYGKDNTTNRLFQRVKELEEENSHLKKNQITLLMKQITEL